MSERVPRSSDAIAPDSDTPLPWERARDHLAAAGSYWLTTARPDGHPHVRPVLAVWVDGALYSTTSRSARKARNLAHDPRCVATTSQGGLDLVLEGVATFVRDDETLRRVAEAYASKYDWPLTIQDGAFDAPYGAPTAGGPPYEAFELTPSVAFGFGTTDEYSDAPATRWRF